MNYLPSINKTKQKNLESNPIKLIYFLQFYNYELELGNTNTFLFYFLTNVELICEVSFNCFKQSLYLLKFGPQDTNKGSVCPAERNCLQPLTLTGKSSRLH